MRPTIRLVELFVELDRLAQLHGFLRELPGSQGIALRGVRNVVEQRHHGGASVVDVDA